MSNHPEHTETDSVDVAFGRMVSRSIGDRDSLTRMLAGQDPEQSQSDQQRYEVDQYRRIADDLQAALNEVRPRGGHDAG